MLIYFFIILSMEIILIILANKNKDKKYYKIFNGLFWGFFISIFLYCIFSYTKIFSYDTGEWVTIGALIQAGFLSILNLVIGAISLLFQRKTKDQFCDTSNKKTTFKCFLIIIFISLIIIISQYMIKYNEKIKIENEIKKETMVYLENKYGSRDFEIVDIDRDFVVNGFIGTNHLDNYNIYAIYIPDNIRFYIYLGVDDSREILRDSFSDRLISTIYSENHFKDDNFINNTNKEIENLNIYLKEIGLNANINLYSENAVSHDNEAVPNKYGKIPSKNELYDLILDYHIKHDLKIEIDKYEITSNNLKSEIRNYLVNLSNYLIDYYNVLNDFKIECYYNDNNGNFFKGQLTINKDYINISGNLIEEKIKK